VKTKLLLIAEEGRARDAYVGVLSGLDVDVDCVASPDEICGTIIEAAYSGLLIDVPTMIRCECADKNRVNRIMLRYPVLRLMFNSSFGGIRGLAQGGTMRDNRDLAEFVLHECVPFPPRSIRVTRRQDILFNVLLLDHPERVGGERTVTINVSEHGCFVFTSALWRLDTPAWLVVREFEDKTPIELRVRWQREWGEGMQLPGIGTTFESMTTHQYVQLHSFL
jgi:hypothetical protein